MRVFRSRRANDSQPPIGDPRDEFISRVVTGRSFCDVGGLWGTVSEKVSVAHASGAVRLAMMDITPADNELWQAFRARLASLDIGEVECISADITSVDPSHRFDVVHCSGVIYHLANPLELLTAFREMVSEHLILSSAVVPTEIRNPAGALSFSPGQALFVPHLDPRTSVVIQRHFSDQEISGALGVTEPVVRWNVDDFAPWWWLFTPTVLRQMLLVSGFEIIDDAPGWNGNAHVFLTRCA